MIIHLKAKILLIICFFVLTGCSDPSSLRSNVEVQINQAFGTKFGLIDQVIVTDLKKKETINVLNPELFSNSLGKMKEITVNKLAPNYLFHIKTTEENEEYSREQTEATLLYSSEKEIICTENKKVCYETSESLRTFLIENKIH
jgi:membrane-associated HD superfamily phosphohydrolase